jgi:hypothetical protein
VSKRMGPFLFLTLTLTVTLSLFFGTALLPKRGGQVNPNSKYHEL